MKVFFLFISLAFATNFNQCAQLLPATAACASLQTGTPDFQGCCSAVQQFQDNGCSCNPIIDGFLASTGGAAALVAGGTQACQALGQSVVVPDCSSAFTPIGAPSGNTATYNNGQCGISDNQLLAARVQSISAFNAVVNLRAPEGQCFDLQVLLRRLAAVIVDSSQFPTFTVQQGLGRYTGINSIVEYIALTSGSLTRNGFQLTSPVDVVNNPPILAIQEEGLSIISGSVAQFDLYNSCLTEFGYLESVFSFTGCNVKISSVFTPGERTRFRLSFSFLITKNFPQVNLSFLPAKVKGFNFSLLFFLS